MLRDDLVPVAVEMLLGHFIGHDRGESQAAVPPALSRIGIETHCGDLPLFGVCGEDSLRRLLIAGELRQLALQLIEANFSDRGGRGTHTGSGIHHLHCRPRAVREVDRLKRSHPVRHGKDQPGEISGTGANLPPGLAGQAGLYRFVDPHPGVSRSIIGVVDLDPHHLGALRHVETIAEPIARRVSRDSVLSGRAGHDLRLTAGRVEVVRHRRFGAIDRLDQGPLGGRGGDQGLRQVRGSHDLTHVGHHVKATRADQLHVTVVDTSGRNIQVDPRLVPATGILSRLKRTDGEGFGSGIGIVDAQ